MCVCVEMYFTFILNNLTFLPSKHIQKYSFVLKCPHKGKSSYSENEIYFLADFDDDTAPYLVEQPFFLSRAVLQCRLTFLSSGRSKVISFVLLEFTNEVVAEPPVLKEKR